MATVQKCQVCEQNHFKYKCPICLIKYCSVACYKKHKESTCAAAAAAKSSSHEHEREQVRELQPVALSQLLLPTEDTVHPALLHELRSSDEVRLNLQDPVLRGQLQRLAACSTGYEAAPLLDGLLRDQKFRGLANACLKVVDPTNNTFDDEFEREVMEEMKQLNR